MHRLQRERLQYQQLERALQSSEVVWSGKFWLPVEGLKQGCGRSFSLSTGVAAPGKQLINRKAQRAQNFKGDKGDYGDKGMCSSTLTLSTPNHFLWLTALLLIRHKDLRMQSKTEMVKTPAGAL